MRNNKKMMFRLTIAMILVIAIAVCILVVKFISNGGFGNTYRLNKKSLSMDLFAVEKLIVTNSKGEAVKASWASDNSCVEVDQYGNLTGNSVGKAKITATIGSKVLTCKVTVRIPKENGVELVLDSEKVEVMLGDSITINARLSYAGTDVELPKLRVQTDESKLSATVSGSVVTLTGLSEAEKVQVTVSCSWNGQKIEKTIPVDVIPYGVVELSSATMDLYTFPHQTNKVEKEVAVKKFSIKGVEYMNPSATWSVSNEKIISVKNGKVTALAEGEADVVATVKHNGKPYRGICHVVVAKTQIDLTNVGKQEIILDQSTRGGKLDIGKYSALNNIRGTIVVDDVSGMEHEITTTLQGTTLKIGAGLWGGIEKAIAIKTEKYDVLVTVTVVNLEISSAKQLLNLSDYVDRDYRSGTYGGYFRLRNNINIGETKVQAKGIWDDYTKGFTGVFDGCGYTINGGLYGPGGLFGVLGEGGVIKNLAITSAGIGVDSYSEFAQNGGWYPGILAGELHGKVTDVFIEICYRKLGWYSDSDGAWGQVMGKSLSNAELTRVVVTHGKLPANKLKTYIDLFAYEGGENDKKVKLVDVYFENDWKAANSDTNFFGVAGTYEGQVIGIPTDDNLNWMITKANFGSIWYLEGKTPQFMSYRNIK